MNWSALWNQICSMEPGAAEICLRLACAMLVGLVIGTEREYTHRPAGLRTHILVALGACVVSVTGELLFTHYASLGATLDPARLSAQVIAGVGFLGAGTIMREGFSVKGLTTAASLWAVACLGIATGFGYYVLALLGMVFIFITLTVFEWLQTKLVKESKMRERYILQTANISEALTLINEKAQEYQGVVNDIAAEPIDKGYCLRFSAKFGGRHSKRHRQNFINALMEAPSTFSLRFSDHTAQAEIS